MKDDDYFGLCPDCRRTGTHHDVRKENWFACDRCKTKWCEGVGLFSVPEWALETGESLEFFWRQNERRLLTHRVVEPYRHPALRAL